MAALLTRFGAAIRSQLISPSDWRRMRNSRGTSPFDLKLLRGQAKVLKHPDPEIRRIACLALQPQRGDAVDAAFCALLADSEPSIFRLAVSTLAARPLSPALTGFLLRRVVPALSPVRAMRMLIALPATDVRIAEQILRLMPCVDDTTFAWEVAHARQREDGHFCFPVEAGAVAQPECDLLRLLAEHAAADNTPETARLWRHIERRLPHEAAHSLLASVLRQAELPGSLTVKVALRHSHDRTFVSKVIRELEAGPRCSAGFLWILEAAPFPEAKATLITSLKGANRFEREIILRALAGTRPKFDDSVHRVLVEEVRAATDESLAETLLPLVVKVMPAEPLYDLLGTMGCPTVAFRFLLQQPPDPRQAALCTILLRSIAGEFDLGARSVAHLTWMQLLRDATGHLSRLSAEQQVLALEPLVLPPGQRFGSANLWTNEFPTYALCTLARKSPLVEDLLVRAALPSNPAEFFHAAAAGNPADPRVVTSAIAALEHPLPEDDLRRLEITSVWDNLGRFGQHPAILAKLLDLAHHPDPDVRWKALERLGPFENRRALAELILALFDQSAAVRANAQRLLDFGPRAVAGLKSSAAGGGVSTWQAIVRQIYAMIKLGESVGATLLGKPVKIEIFREGLGRTRRVAPAETAEIFINPTAIAEAHEHGVDICHGLVLHEIGHNLADFPVPSELGTRINARRMGVQGVYDLLCDERLERIVRSRLPESGPCFDRLASYAFSQATQFLPLSQFCQFAGKSPDAVRNEIAAGQLAYRVIETSGEPNIALTPVQFFALPAVDQPFLGFMHCLRVGFEPQLVADPRVRAALEKVPASLRTLSHAEVLRVAREIGAILGTDRAHRKAMERLARLLKELGNVVGTLSDLLWRMSSSALAPEICQDALPHFARLPSQLRARANGPKVPAAETQPDPVSSGPIVYQINQSLETHFDRLPLERTLRHDRSRHARAVSAIRTDIQRLRPFFQNLGERPHRETDLRRGHHLDAARLRTLAWRPQFDLWVSDTYRPATDLHLSLVIDRSGSMSGEKLQRAVSFSILISECTRGIPGIEGNVYSFDDQTFWHLGDLRHPASSSLESGGGNNDAAALWRAAELARQSRRTRKLIVMISDGMPTQCSFNALRFLVQELEREPGLTLAQVAVDRLTEVAFPHYVDLSAHNLSDAVVQFGRTIHRLITQGNHRVVRAPA